MSTIAKSIDSDFLNTTTYLKEIIESLKRVGLENKRCVVCSGEVIQREDAPCCSATCAREVVALSIMLEAALQSQHTDPQRFEPERTNLIHIRDKVAERAMNWMLVIVLNSSNTIIQRRTRQLLLALCMKSKTFPSSISLGDSVDQRVLKAEGGFAKVFLGTYKQMDVALKELRWDSLLVENPGDRDSKLSPKEMAEWRFRYEALIWKSLSHERFNPLLGVNIVDGLYGMVSPWHHDGDAMTFLKVMIKAHERFRWSRFYRTLVYRWLLQVTEGLKNLHSQGISHGDLHPKNILVVNSQRGDPMHTGLDIVLTDFGLSVLQDANSREQHSLRYGYFRAPEQIDCSQYPDLSQSGRPSEVSDIFTFAALCYQLYTLKKPYEGEYPPGSHYPMTSALLRYQLPKKEIDVNVLEERITVTIPDELWEIIVKCWTRPESRPTLDWIENKLKSMQRSLSIPS